MALYNQEAVCPKGGRKEGEERKEMEKEGRTMNGRREGGEKRQGEG